MIYFLANFRTLSSVLVLRLASRVVHQLKLSRIYARRLDVWRRALRGPT
jgi:hypothetical protein